jgi:hypothetical protein
LICALKEASVREGFTRLGWAMLRNEREIAAE